ncbi:uncharacterized protein LOC111350331 isoform X1 [Spodoptera litura]|uniref:Uncharacterized protein LOC111350331 isoform X1 n=1 Tax=Spodoptera litura TaxID=69820 RepID=A0A9J7DWM0_SPOLT|nr:uncharacterized protein LOC111350331 isoform X1 [Spodoptera litura]
MSRGNVPQPNVPNVPQANTPNVSRGNTSNMPRGNVPNVPEPNRPNVPRNVKRRIFRNTSDNGIDVFQTNVCYYTKTGTNITRYKMNSNDVIRTGNFIKNQGKCEPSLQCIYLHEEHPLQTPSDYNKLYIPNTRTFGQCYAAPLKLETIQKAKPSRGIFTTLFFCCLGDKSQGANLPSTIPVAHSQKDVHVINSFNCDSYDFGCQYSLKSTHSLEIISQMLTRSYSNMSSTESDDSARNRFRKNKKRRSDLFVMMYTLARKIKDKNSKFPIRKKKNNVVVLRVPKQFSNASNTGSLSKTPTCTKLEKPLTIRDESSHEQISYNCVSSRNKIWGPGEVLLKKP